MQINTIIGWDIGGAHVKATLFNNNQIQQVVQFSCALWQGLDQLTMAIEKVLGALEVSNQPNIKHAITMTGELADLFQNRKKGVMQIAETLESALMGQCQYYHCAANAGFVSQAQLTEYWSAIASANWHASAQLIADEVETGLLIDIGSTTTDIIALDGGQVMHQGSTDAARMRSGELVYTGVVRTPLMALGHGDQVISHVRA